MLNLGIFADGTYGDGFNGVAGTVRGILYGDASQLVAQIIGPLANFGFIFGASWLFFKAMDVVMGMRVSPEVELEGLDVPEMGTHGYPEIQGPGSLVHGLVGGTSRSHQVPAGVIAAQRGR